MIAGNERRVFPSITVLVLQALKPCHVEAWHVSRAGNCRNSSCLPTQNVCVFVTILSVNDKVCKSIEVLAFVLETLYVFCDVGTEFIYIFGL
jgi:hypothetical protein